MTRSNPTEADAGSDVAGIRSRPSNGERSEGANIDLAIGPPSLEPGRLLQPDGHPEGIVRLLADPADRPGIAATAYDTAWLAGIPQDNGPNTPEPQFPEAVQWLLDNQWSDGSWGGAVRYEHDRMLCTLAALAALRAFGRKAEHEACIEDGTRYLWQHGHLLANEPTEPVAFELLLPTMVRRAQKAGISVPPHLDIYFTERAEKLRLIPAGALYSPRVTLVHSLEFLGDQADLSGLRAAQGANGSIGNSPAATSFFYQRSRDPSALDYLQSCAERFCGARAPVLYPCETYELLWAAYHLYLGGIPVSKLIDQADRDFLNHALRQGGVSLSPTFPIPDADDTAVALLFLSELGESPEPRVLKAFELPEGHFASFPYERHSSVGVSLHTLHALLRVPGYPGGDRTIDRLLDYLTSQQIGGLYWLDKWHVSPYYATAHALCILRELPPEQGARMDPLIRRSREWLRRTQNADGSWGFLGKPTIEETAYALLALASGNSRHIIPQDHDSCTAAARYLQRQWSRPLEPDDDLLPALWLDKCLYTPTLIVMAVIEGALEAFRRFRQQHGEGGAQD